MTAPWLHVRGVLTPGTVVALEADELRHAVGAKRLREGDALTLFDGAGRVAGATLVERGRSALIDAVQPASRPTPHVTIAAALPKGDHASTMIDLCTQLGMSLFIPLRCERSVVGATTNGIARLQRVAVEACKQSRRAWFPAFAPEVTPLGAAEEGLAANELVIVAHVAGAPLADVLRADRTARGEHRSIRFLIGPEGGFAQGEFAALHAAKTSTASLGPYTLRIETAASAACALAAGVSQSASLGASQGAS